MEESTIFHYGVYLFTAVLAGVVRYYTRVNNGEELMLSDLVAEMVISAFIGLILSFIAFGLQLTPPVAGVLIGMGAHEGTRVMVTLKKRINEILPFKLFNEDE